MEGTPSGTVRTEQDHAGPGRSRHRRSRGVCARREGLAESAAYRGLLERVEQCYRTDAGFFRACLGASGWTLERRLPAGQTPTNEQLCSAARYFLAELPLFLDTPQITGEPVSVFCYHQVPGFLDDLFRLSLSLSPAVGQGFLRVSEVTR